MRNSALMKAYLWSTNDGNDSWTINGSQGPRQGTKSASGKIANFFLPILILVKHLFHDSSFMDVDTALQITPMSCSYS